MLFVTKPEILSGEELEVRARYLIDKLSRALADRKHRIECMELCNEMCHSRVIAASHCAEDCLPTTKRSGGDVKRSKSKQTR